MVGSPSVHEGRPARLGFFRNQQKVPDIATANVFDGVSSQGRTRSVPVNDMAVDVEHDHKRAHGLKSLELPHRQCSHPRHDHFSIRASKDIWGMGAAKRDPQDRALAAPLYIFCARPRKLWK